MCFKISIITAVLNGRATLESCIQSVLSQQYPNIEHIIIDGGSTDGTLDIIQKYNNDVAYWVSEPDHGIYDAMNKGIRLASGEIVGILNADDCYFDQNVLKKVSDVMNDPSIDACYSDLVYVDMKDLNKVVRYWRSRHFEHGLFEKGWVPAHPTFFVRKKTYDNYGMFDLNYKLAADFELLARFLVYYRIKTAYVPRIFVKMRLGGATNKSVANIVKQNSEIVQACRKNKIKISVPLFLMRKFLSRLHQFYIKPAT